MIEIIAGPKLMYPIDRPKPHPQNARQHSEDQVMQLAKSIQEFGFTQPILVDENDTILAGHGKWLAACPIRIRGFELAWPNPITIVTETHLGLYGMVTSHRSARGQSYPHPGLPLRALGHG
jgi:ParB-like nuclease domain